MIQKNVLQLFLDQVKKQSNRPCLRFKIKGKWKSISWLEVHEKIGKLSQSLHKLGVKKGDTVVILSATRYEWTLADMAILSLGAVTVPIYHSTLPKDVAYILNHSQAKIAFIENAAQFKKVEAVHKELKSLKKIISFDKISDDEVYLMKTLLSESAYAVEDFEYRCHSIHPEDLATVVYTSGTTGQPKGVMLAHRCLSSEIEALSQLFELSEEKESLLFLPLAHILARGVQFYQLTQGFVHAYAESIDKLMDDIREVRPHFMISVPRIFEKIYTKILSDLEGAPFYKKEVFKWAVRVGKRVSELRQKKKSISWTDQIQHQIALKLVFNKLHQRLGGQLKFFISGGAPLSQEIGEFFDAANVHIFEGYGLTETTAAVNCNSPQHYRFGTVGQVLANVEEKLGPDGEILVRGAHVFQGYFRDEAATKEAFTADGFFKTGDIGEFNDDGTLRITDRKKDLIVTAAGKNIAPQYIENLLKTDALFSQVMVHGDKRKFLSALVTLNPESLKDWAKSHQLETFDYALLTKHPKVFQLVKKRLDEKNKQLASYESIKRFGILEEDFSIEKGDLTPTLKIKRKVVSEKYKDLLDSFYKE